MFQLIATSVQLYEGNTVIKSQNVTNAASKIDVKVTGKANGTYNYKVVTKNGNDTVESSVVSVYVGPAINLKAPVISSSVKGSDTGEYTITVSVPENSNGQTMDVYENGVKIGSETITTAAKDFNYSIKGKTNGNYTYFAVLKNGTKSIESNTKSVKVLLKLNSTVFDPNSANYSMGSLVEYNGKVYEGLAWYIPAGTNPEKDTKYWKYVQDVLQEDVIDLATVAAKYNVRKDQSSYDEECDLNNDGIIDLYDLVLVARNM